MTARLLAVGTGLAILLAPGAVAWGQSGISGTRITGQGAGRTSSSANGFGTNAFGGQFGSFAGDQGGRTGSMYGSSMYGSSMYGSRSSYGMYGRNNYNRYGNQNYSQYGTNSNVTMPTARYTLGTVLTRPVPAGQVGTVNPELSQRLGKSTRVQFRSQPEVFVQGGIATLRGAVATDHDRVLAEGLVRLEPGIVAVNNELTLASAGSLPAVSPPPSVLTPAAGSSRGR